MLLKEFLKEWGDWILAGIFLWYIFILPVEIDILHGQARNGIVFAACFVSYLVGKKLKSKVAGWALAYFLTHSIFTFTSMEYTPRWASFGALSSFSWLASILAVVMFLTDKQRARAIDALGVLCLLSSSVLIGRRIAGLDPYFVLNNSAADACLIAALCPVVAFRRWLPESLDYEAKKWLYRSFIALPVAAIAASGSSSAIVALAIALLVHAAQYRKQVSIRWAGASLASVLLAGAGLYAFSPDVPFSDSGRYMVWKNAYDFATQSMSEEAVTRYRQNTDPRVTLYLDRVGNSITGMGTGAFKPLSTGIQLANHPDRPKTFPFVHSDPVEIFFDQGWLGVFLAGLVLAVALLRALDDPYLFTALSTYAAISFVQFPLRYYGSAIIGALLLREAFALEGKAWKGTVSYLRSLGLLETLRLRAVLLLAGMFPIRAKVWHK